MKCRKCGSQNVSRHEHESACGSFLDYRFECANCPHMWFVDGADS